MRGGWKEDQYHSDLCLPQSHSIARDGLIITFEAMASECVALTLSPETAFVTGKTYEIHFGANGNLSTVIRRKLTNGQDCIENWYTSLKVCTLDKWSPYWISLYKGKLSAGIGRQPGLHCLGTFDDSMYEALRPGHDAVRYVGLGNSVVGRKLKYPPVKIRHLKVMPIPPYILENANRKEFPVNPITLHTLIHLQVDQGEWTQLLKEYEEECAKGRARAEKYGSVYKEPPAEAFFRWSDARRLWANPTKGFATGFDVTSQQEEEKRKARMERFAKDKKRKSVDGEEKSAEGENTPIADNAMLDVMPSVKRREPLPVIEAWDNEELVRSLRVDPPLQSVASNSSNTGVTAEEDLIIGEEVVREETKDEMQQDNLENPELVPEKIHVFAIDWAAFKQIRTEDIMAHFSIYGPSYVEWLGELSCNVLFEDRFSAARAIMNLSQAIPSPPPPDLAVENPPDLGALGWTFCVSPIYKLVNDRFGRRGTRARALMRVANTADVLDKRPEEKPQPPPGFTTQRVLGPGSDFDTSWRQQPKNKRQRQQRKNHRRTKEDADEDMQEDEYVKVVPQSPRQESDILDVALKSARR